MFSLTLTEEASSLRGNVENIPSISWWAFADENEAASHTTSVGVGESVACCLDLFDASQTACNGVNS